MLIDLEFDDGWGINGLPRLLLSCDSEDCLLGLLSDVKLALLREEVADRSMPAVEEWVHKGHGCGEGGGCP